MELTEALTQLGFDEFRPGQREAVEMLLETGRLLLVAPTGGGKSLTYQLPALLLPGTTLVISPLIALMQDQVEALQRKGVAATYLAATLGYEEMVRRQRELAQGNFKLAYVAPERLFNPGFQQLVQRLECPLVAVDEAHCISEWGHDFRPEYLQIGTFCQRLRPPRILACTATATPVVRDEIVARLGLGDDTPQFVRGFARPNLTLRAAEVSGKSERSRHVDSLLAEALKRPGLKQGTAIIYGPTRRSTEEESARLAQRGWRTTFYHAGLSGDLRATAQRSFISGEVDVVVATNAFGMGIDRSDVRGVVHLAPPGSIEAYYQEVGRAGRDGEEAFGLLLTGPGDLPLRRRLLEQDGAANPDILEHKWNLFLELMRWIEGGSCRHDAILRYFGADGAQGGCGKCDVCLNLDATGDDEDRVETLVRQALCGVARLHGRYGLGAAVKLLRGDSDPRLERAGLHRVPTYGVLRDEPAPWLTRVMRRLVTAGWVSFTGDDRPRVLLTGSGHDVIHGRAPARVLLPPKQRKRPSPEPRRLKGRAEPRLVSLHDEQDPLFESLRGARLAMARNAGVPPYVVASDRTLRDLAATRPTSRDEMYQIYGMGPSRVKRFGERFLSVIREEV